MLASSRARNLRCRALRFSNDHAYACVNRWLRWTGLWAEPRMSAAVTTKHVARLSSRAHTRGTARPVRPHSEWAVARPMARADQAPEREGANHRTSPARAAHN